MNLPKVKGRAYKDKRQEVATRLNLSNSVLVKPETNKKQKAKTQKKETKRRMEYDPKLIFDTLLNDNIGRDSDEEEESKDLYYWTGQARPPNIHFSTFVKPFLPSSNNNNDNNTIGMMSIESQIANTMKRAYFDGIFQEMMDDEKEIEERFSGIQQLLFELHSNIRNNLVPNRKDLHLFLNDEQVKSLSLSHNESNMSSSSENEFNRKLESTVIQKCLFQCGEALIELEAPDRAESTREWISYCTTENVTTGSDNTNAARVYPHSLTAGRFAIFSVAFLLEKTNLCHLDIQNFKFEMFYQGLISNNRIRAIEILRNTLDKVVETDAWIRCTSEISEALVQYRHAHEEKLLNVSTKEQRDRLYRQLESDRKNILLQKGLVESILFYTEEEIEQNDSEVSTKKGRTLPEVLQFNYSKILEIRKLVKLSSIGSALALHACVAAEVPIGSLDNNDNTKEEDPGTIQIQAEKNKLLKAMKKGRGKDGEELTEELLESIIGLTNALVRNKKSSSQNNSNNNRFGVDSSDEKKTLLLSRATAVLRNEDPVMNLFHSRVKQYFSKMVICNVIIDSDSNIPSNMRTGLLNNNNSTHYPTLERKNRQKIEKARFLELAQEEASNLGYSLYKVDLSKAAWMCKQMGDLMFELYGPTLFQLMENADSFNNTNV